MGWDGVVEATMSRPSSPCDLLTLPPPIVRLTRLTRLSVPWPPASPHVPPFSWMSCPHVIDCGSYHSPPCVFYRHLCGFQSSQQLVALELR